jgi:hypothetical protein
MAKLNEQMFVIKVSELLRDNQEAKPPLDPEIMAQLEVVIGELAGPGKIVELIQDTQ